MVKELSDKEFVNEVESFPGVVFVDFYSTSCAPCQMIAPIFERAETRYPRIKFCKVNIDKHIMKAAQYAVTAIPCIIVFRGGKMVERVVGFGSELEFEETIKKYAVGPVL